LFRPIRELSIELDKVRLVIYLDEIASSFSRMVTEKREVATLLAAQQSDAASLRLAFVAQNLVRSVRIAVERINGFAGRLPGVCQTEGKGWLGELTSQRTDSNGFVISDEQRARYAREALVSADALDADFSELLKLVTYAKQSPA